MAGQGSGLLQPTKLIQADDFMPSIAPPGYQFEYSSALAAGALNLYVVPDGMTVEIVDFGVTAVTDVVDTAATTESSIKLDAVLGGSTTNVVAAAAITGGGGATTTLSAGSTASILRGTVPGSGDAGYAFTAASTALNDRYGAGTLIKATLADTHGTGSTGSAGVWVRLKYYSKDNGDV